eukprot:TRINITY_DN37044_c0_g1_i1.p1 TRINITY_DN37044_c0_g1~~TRINITY_DN37044_c0_g1_i1.p1  ORF type:complete len:173 (-),score=22.45 TRINITY_DN37044_c0_g1_i1:295-813(-)
MLRSLVGSEMCIRDSNGDMVTTRLQGHYGLRSFASVTVCCFGATQLISQIPIFGLIARKNLVKAGWMKRKWATAVVLGSSWAVTIACYTGNALDGVLDWTGMLVVPLCNFLVPLLALGIVYCSGAQSHSSASLGAFYDGSRTARSRTLSLSLGTSRSTAHAHLRTRCPPRLA